MIKSIPGYSIQHQEGSLGWNMRVALEIFSRGECLSSPAALNPGCLHTTSGWEAECSWWWRNCFALNYNRNTRLFKASAPAQPLQREPLGLGQDLPDQVTSCDPQNSQEPLAGCLGKQAWQSLDNALRHKVWFLGCSVQGQELTMIFMSRFQLSRSCDSVTPP